MENKTDSAVRKDKPVRFCFEADFKAPTASGRFARELLLASRGLEMAVSALPKISYAHQNDCQLPVFFKKIFKRPPSGKIRISCLPAFALKAPEGPGIHIATGFFDPLVLTDREISGMAAYQFLLVPSNAHKIALLKAGINERKIIVFPPAVNLKIFHPKASAPDLISKEPIFRFLAVLNPLRRKGLETLLAAYLKEFSPREPVELVLKITHMPKPKKNFSYEIGDLMQRLGSWIRDFPRLRIIVSVVPDAELAGLMASCNALVAVNHTFNTALCVREAMACGLPVIGPKSLAQIANLSQDFAYFTETGSGEKPEGFLFAHSSPAVVPETTMSSLRTALRNACGNPDECRKMGVRARLFAERGKSWQELDALLLEKFAR